MTLRMPPPSQGSPDLSHQDDVYVDVTPDSHARPPDRHESCTVRVHSDASPMVLARIFDLMSTFGIVPVSTRSTTPGNNTMTTALEIGGVDSTRIELLCRKIRQLTETVSVART